MEAKEARWWTMPHAVGDGDWFRPPGTPEGVRLRAGEHIAAGDRVTINAADGKVYRLRLP